MNEVGLVFSRLASWIPERVPPPTGRKKITDEIDYLTSILHTCATVAEVKAYIEQYNHHIFLEDVFIYVDSAGDYLVVEPYELIEGNDPTYVLSNFCPSITTHEKAREIERYRNGEDFLGGRTTEATVPFCKAVSDTMHVCRSRNGDGTLLTSIWDTKEKRVNLYFYHDFDHTVQFNLTEELAKGDQILNTDALFPENSEFKRLVEYRTPFNTPLLRILLVITGAGLMLLAILLLGVFFRNRKEAKYYLVFLVASLLNLVLTGYFAVLATHIGIYYFDAPYKHGGTNLISLSSYTPFILVLCLIPILFLVVRFMKNERKRIGEKILVIFNSIIYLVSFCGFLYWGLFDILN